jgi:hypothetical protein
MTTEQGRLRVETMLGTMILKPRSLARALLSEVCDDDCGPAAEADLPSLFDLMLSDDPNESARLRFGDLLRKWDNARDADWVGQTSRNTRERRDLIYDLLQAGPALRQRISETLPHCSVGEPLIVSDEHRAWYKPEKITEESPKGFYWRAYSGYLHNKGWPADSIVALDNSTREIVSRLADPGDAQHAFRARGLVMGYVQSGKTANFTGVIAKAIDSGYRLIIVLAGTWNMLRDQTQRRLDKELVGKPLLASYPHDYGLIPDDWDAFVDHGQCPSMQGTGKIERLTGLKVDYTRLKAAIGALNFDPIDPAYPFNHPSNLQRSPCRLIVIKKIPSRLDALCNDLAAIRDRLLHVPALVIDDESDQAGINTLRPTAQDRERRTKTNKSIVKLLDLLPLGQYIGYTATPYANFLVDPEDEADLFPRHFILPLDRPPGYMGISDFFDPDISSDDIPEADYTYKERAYVRDAHDSDLPEYEESMKKALASYVLAGAVKLYREAHEEKPRPRFKHHTMLVHSSHTNVAHSEDVKNVDRIFRESAFGGTAARNYLQKLWETDFVPVMQGQGAAGAVPSQFDDLYRCVGPALDKITRGQIIRVLNSSEGGDRAPDFDRDDVWEIIVGGNKLSRGYTIEGLTISYYLRKATAADTLMQMGRWFGFRQGYRDVVRIFVGRSQGNQGIDLVDHFKQACAMEERSRTDIRRYARKADGKPLRPIDVPPLIAISGNLPPTAKNKMWNAVIKDKNYKDQWVMPTRMPEIKTAAEANLAAATLLWRNASDIGVKRLGGTYEDGKSHEFIAALREISLQQFVAFLESFKWIKDTPPTDFHLLIDFLKTRKHQISGCMLVAPQLQNPSLTDRWEGLTVKERKRMEGAKGTFQGFGEPKHRAVADYWTGRSARENIPGHLIQPNTETPAFRDSHRMVCLVYPVRAKRPDGGHENFVTLGFEMLFPDNNLTPGLSYTTLVKNNNPVVDATEVEQ